jgi:hypothetical protein
VRSSLPSVLVVLAVLSACGGGEDPVVADGATDEATDDRPAGYDSEWCVSARELADTSAAIDAVDPNDPEAVRAAVTEMLASTEAAAPLAPAEIADDVAESLATFQALDAALAEVDYDLLRADLTGIADDLSATERVDAYNAEVCGLDLGDPTTSEPASDIDLTEGSVRDQIVATLVAQGFSEEQAGCILDSIDPTEAATMSEEELLLGVIAACGIDDGALED